MSTPTQYGKQATGLLLRKSAHYVPVELAMAPLFRYMRQQTSDTDSIYLIHVDPSEITQSKLFPPDALPATGPDAVYGCVGGPWDRATLSFKKHYLYQSIRAHLQDGVGWEDTQIYDHPKYADDPDRARKRCAKIEHIIESIRTNGYRLQHDLDHATDTSYSRIGTTEIADEIIVGMDRHGGLLHLKNGRHRLAVTQLLGVDRIPVILSLSHPGATDAIPADAKPLRSNTDGIESCYEMPRFDNLRVDDPQPFIRGVGQVITAE